MTFETPIKKTLSELVRAILPNDIAIDEACLLKAYATFLRNEMKDGPRPSNCSLFLDIIQGDAYDKAKKIFLGYKVIDFILIINSMLIGSPYKIALLYEQRKIQFLDAERKYLRNEPLMALGLIYVIFSCKRILAELAEKTADRKNGNIYYSRYRDEAIRLNFPYVEEKTFKNIAEATCIIRQDQSSEFISEHIDSYLTGLIAVLANDYGYSRQEREDLITNIFDNNKEFLPSNRPFSFKRIEAEKTYINEIRDKLLGNQRNATPVEALAAHELAKKSEFRNLKEPGRTTNTNTRRPTNLPIELTQLHDIFASATLGHKTTSKILIIFPSLPFIMKWAENESVSMYKTCFVMPSKNVARLLTSTYSATSGFHSSPNPNLSFISYSEWLANSNPDKKQIMLFLEMNFMTWLNRTAKTETDKSDELNRFKKRLSLELDENATIYGLSLESYLTRQEYLLHHIATGNYYLNRNDKKGFHLTDIISIPRRGQDENTYRQHPQLLWRAERKHQAPCSVYMMQNGKATAQKINNAKFHMANKARLLTYEDLQTVQIDFREMFGNHISTLRKQIQHQSRTTTTSKQNPLPLPFTNEITLFYTISDQHYWKNSKKPAPKKKVNVFIKHNCRENQAEAIHTRGKGMNNVVSNSIISLYVDAYIAEQPELLQKYILALYPYYVTRPYKDREQRNVRKIIAGVYKKEFSSYTEMTLKTFLYINPDLDVYLKGYGYLRHLFRPLSDRFIRELSQEDFFNCIIKEDRLPDQKSIVSIIQAIYNLLNQAKADHLCEKNVIEDLVENDKEFNKALGLLRSALTKKHFSSKEFQALYATIEKVYSETKDPIYIGVMIKLFTGLASHSICALRWSDVKNIPECGFCQLHIIRQLSGDGKSILPLKSDDDIRCLPCSLLLTKFLLKNRPDKKTRGKPILPETSSSPDIKYDEEETIPRDKYLTTWKPGEEPCFPSKPSLLDRKTKEILDKVFPNQNLFTLSSDENDKGAEVDLAKYKGNIFRENLRYWATEVCACDDDEIAHLLGNAKVTTLGTSYRDFNNTFTQYLIHSKLARMDAAILFPKEKYECTYFEMNSKKKSTMKIPPSGRNPHVIEMEITSKSGKEPLISLECEHGNIQTKTIIKKMEEQDVQEE